MSFIRISSQLNVREEQIANVMRIKNAEIINDIEKVAVYVLKELAPVRTGELRDSIKILQSSRRQSGGRFKGFIRIGPTASHAKYIIKGTRYMKPRNFVRRSKPIIIQESNRLINERYGPGKFNITRYFKN